MVVWAGGKYLELALGEMKRFLDSRKSFDVFGFGFGDDNVS